MVRARRAAEWIATIFIALACATAGAQQVVDADFIPIVNHPEYKAGKGPVVMIDEAHFNYHTASGQYEPFARLLTLDGFRVRPFKLKFSKVTLKEADILVIANPLSEATSRDWTQPSTSAFTDDEVESLLTWIRKGGALMLVADHMPIPGAIQKIAAALGVTWSDGYAQDPRSGGIIAFERSNGALANHAITNRRNEAERIDKVVTFAGSAFQAPGATPILIFTGEAVAWLPKVPGRFEPGTPSISVKGWQQGAVLRIGKGRVALFGEAAMFTAQRVGPGKDAFGMNAPAAPQNKQFALNVVHWLAGKLD